VETYSNYTLSVITVAANDLDRLKISLDSFVGASKSVEFVVVCPKDDIATIGFMKSFIQGSDLTISLQHDSGSGVYQAMNQGANFSKGRYLVFWNAGDSCSSVNDLNDFVVDLGSSSQEWGIFHANFDWREKQVLNLNSLKWFVLQLGGYISHQSVVMKKINFESQGRFDLTFKVAADTALITKFWKRYRVRFFDFTLVNVEFPKFSAKHNRLGRIENLKIAFLLLPWKFKIISICFALFRELKYACKRACRTLLRTEEK
jgi:hypothetical protein